MEQIIESIRIINDELGSIQIDVAVLKAQVGQILWLQRIVLGLLIVFVVSKVFNKVFNNRK